jgi:SAM-dependent methyltransferase
MTLWRIHNTSRGPEEAEMLARFARQYALSQAPAMLEVERDVCGCAFGSTGWATKEEAEQIGTLLELAPGKHLLDLGAGSGWPGLYLASRSGCDVALADIPLEGMRIAAERAAADGLAGKAWAVVSDGAALPFADASFDAIEHSDVLCCLEAKITVLAECRRVVRATGRMVFSTISFVPSLSSADHRQALAAGPPFMIASNDYPAMLSKTGWKTEQWLDVTADYGAAVERFLSAEEVKKEALIEIFGESDLAEMIAKRRRTVAAIKQGLLRRELFATSAVA